MIEAGSVVVRFIGDDKSFQAATKRFTADMGRIAKRSAMVAGIVAAAAAKMAADFDKGLREISTLLNDVTEKDIKRMGKEIKTLGIESGQSLQALTKARYDIISAGFTQAADSAIMLNTATRLAVGGVTSVANSADILTTTLNAYQLSAKKANYVSDVLFTTVRLGKTTMDLLGGSLGMALPFAKAAGVALKDVGASMATLTASGLQTAIATTAFKNAMVSLTAPTQAAAEEMAKAGISVKRFNDGTMDLLGTIKQFQGMSLDQIMKFIPEKRAATAILSLSQNYEKLKNNIQEFGNVAGATATAYEKMQKSFAVQFARFGNIIKTTMISLGEEILPAILPIVQEIGKALVDNADNIAAFFKKIGNFIRKAALDFNGFIKTISLVVLAVKGLQIALIALGAATTTNPIGLIITAAAAAVTLLITTIKRLKEGAVRDIGEVRRRFEELGIEAEKTNKLMKAHAMTAAREDVAKYEKSLGKLGKELLRVRKNHMDLSALAGANALYQNEDGSINVKKLREELGRLVQKYEELNTNLPDQRKGLFADNRVRNSMLDQIDTVEKLIDLYTDYIGRTDQLEAAQKRLSASMRAASSTGLKLTPYEDVDYFADYEMPEFEIPNVDDVFDADETQKEADAAAKASAWYYEQIKKNADAAKEHQARVFQELAMIAGDAIGVMESAFYSFYEDMKSENVTVADSFKNLWKNILTGFADMVAGLIARMLALALGYVALNLITQGALGDILAIATGRAGDTGFFNGLVGAFSGEMTPGNIAKAFDSMQDGIITPSGEIIKTDPNDYIMAAKDPGSFAMQAQAIGGGGGAPIVNITIKGAMDGNDVYRTLVRNAGKVRDAFKTITKRHF